MADDEKAGCRKFLSCPELQALDEEERWTIENVRDAVNDAAKISADMRGEDLVLDPELLLIIDLRTDFDVYIIGDTAHDEHELVAAYPQLGTADPRTLCVRQEVAMFKTSEDVSSAFSQTYVSRDEGGGDFMLIADEVRLALNGLTSTARQPDVTTKTHVYIAREAWADFKLAQRLSRVITTFASRPALCGPGGSGFAPLALTFAAAAAPSKTEDVTGTQRQSTLSETLAELEAVALAAATQLLDQVETQHAERAAALRTLEARAAKLRKAETALSNREDMLIDGLAGLDSLSCRAAIP